MTKEMTIEYLTSLIVKIQDEIKEMRDQINFNTNRLNKVAYNTHSNSIALQEIKFKEISNKIECKGCKKYLQTHEIYRVDSYPPVFLCFKCMSENKSF